MVSETPTEGRCNYETGGGYCEGWEMDNGFCQAHGGQNYEGAPEGNQNATTHGLYALPENLKAHFSETQQDRYTAYFEALCSRYERLHGRAPDSFAKDRLSRVAIECVKERIADDYLSKKAEETGNLLIESYIIDTNESGEPIEVESENQILKELTALKRETRLQLKDMGLLSDPESKKADAMGDLKQLWTEDLES